MSKLQCFKVDNSQLRKGCVYLVVDFAGERIFGFTIKPDYKKMLDRLDEFYEYKGGKTKVNKVDLAIADLATYPEKVWEIEINNEVTEVLHGNIRRPKHHHD